MSSGLGDRLEQSRFYHGGIFVLRPSVDLLRRFYVRSLAPEHPSSRLAAFTNSLPRYIIGIIGEGRGEVRKSKFPTNFWNENSDFKWKSILIGCRKRFSFEKEIFVILYEWI